MNTRTSHKAGLPPGTLVHVGAASKEPLRLRAIRYGRDTVEEFEPASPEEAAALAAPDRILWIDFCGVHHVEALARLGERFGIHPLVMEDVANTAQRPKAEGAGDHLYVVVRDLRFDGVARRMASEQVSIVLGRGVVLTFRERQGDLFDAVRERIRRAAGRIRAMGADYLAHALLDVVVDRYFIATEALSEELDLLEEEVLATGGLAATRRMHELRRAILTLRRAAWPLGETFTAVEMDEAGLISPEAVPYFRDVNDHLARVIDALDHQREILSAANDVHLSRMSHRMNETMTVLTIIATLFIPLTFLVGVYGMNFRHMPELEWRWGYPLVWIVMAATAGGMLVYFRKRRWI